MLIAAATHDGHSTIHSFIRRISLTPLQNNLLRGAPMQTNIDDNEHYQFIVVLCLLQLSLFESLKHTLIVNRISHFVL